MSPIIYVLERYSLPEFISAGRGNFGINKWLAKTSFFTAVDGNCIELSGFQYADFIKSLSFDYQRFLFSSLESFISKKEGTFGEKANAWPAIRRYYGAFFAAHSLMRALGISISYLGSEEATALSNWLSVFATDVSLRKGTYCIKYGYNEGTGQLSLRHCDSRGGVHEQFWSEFGSWLDDLEEIVVRDDLMMAEPFLSDVTDIKNILRGRGGFNYNWLSYIRNNVNYKHELGLWLFDYKRNRNYSFPNSAKIDRRSENIDLRIDPRREPLRAFNSGCNFLVCLAAELAQRLNHSAPSSRRTFLQQNWQRIAADKIDCKMPDVRI